MHHMLFGFVLQMFPRLKLLLAIEVKRVFVSQLSLAVTIIRNYGGVWWIDICGTMVPCSLLQVPQWSDTPVRRCPQNSVQEPCDWCRFTLKTTLDMFKRSQKKILLKTKDLFLRSFKREERKK